MKLQDFKDAKSVINTSLQSSIIDWVTENIDLSVSTDEEIKKFAHEIYLSIDEPSISDALILKRELKKGTF